MAQISTAWPKMAQMALKHIPWVYYMIICHVGPPWALFRGPRGPLNGPKHHQDGPKYHQNGAVLDILVLFWAIFGPPGASEKVPGWSNMTLYHVIYPWEVFQVRLGSCMDIWGHEGPFWWYSGPSWWCFWPFRGPRGPLKRAQGGLTWHIIM